MAKTDKKTKLTARQVVTLKQLAGKGVQARYIPYRGRFGDAYWYLTDTHQSATQQVGRLIDVGLLDRTVTNDFNGSGFAIINTAGRAYLKAVPA